MKKSVLSVLLICLLICMPILSHASSDLEDYPGLYDLKEYEDVKMALLASEMITEGGILGSPANLFHIVSAYKVYHYTIKKSATQFIDDLMDNNEFINSITEDYHWMVITDEHAAIKIVRKSGQWEVSGFRHPSSQNKPTPDISRDAFEKALSGIEAASVKAFEVADIYTTFLFLQANDALYVVPFSSRPDFNLLENGKRYTPEEAGRILRTSDYYTAPLKPGEIGGGGTAPTPIWPVIIVIAILLAIALGIIVVIKKRKANTR